MLIASKSLKAFIASQKSKTALAEKLGVSKQYLRLIEKGGQVPSDTIPIFIEITGFDYEKAFESK